MNKKSVTLIGSIELEGSKIGKRFLQFYGREPYSHTAALTVIGDAGAEDDDSLNDALQPFFKGIVKITADVDENGDLTTTPARIAKVAGSDLHPLERGYG